NDEASDRRQGSPVRRDSGGPADGRWPAHRRRPGYRVLRNSGHSREQRGRLSSRESVRDHGRTLGRDPGRQSPGSILAAAIVAPGMMAQQRGKIINISSLAAKVGCEGHAAYSASKGGLNMLTRVMAAEWGPFNIQTNAVAPTVVLTDMGKMAWGDEEKSAPVKARIPLHRFGTPLEIADLVLFLAAPASDLICGQVVFIDGGYSAV